MNWSMIEESYFDHQYFLTGYLWIVKYEVQGIEDGIGGLGKRNQIQEFPFGIMIHYHRMLITDDYIYSTTSVIHYILSQGLYKWMIIPIEYFLVAGWSWHQHHHYSYIHIVIDDMFICLGMRFKRFCQDNRAQNNSSTKNHSFENNPQNKTATRQSL